MKKNKYTKKKRKLLIKEFNEKKLKILKSSIKKFSKKIPLYNIFHNTKTNIKTHSFYDMSFYNTDVNDNNNYNFNGNLKDEPIDYDSKSDKLIKCEKIILLPTDIQKKLLLDMLEGYRLIYNLTLKFIKKRYFNKKLNSNNDNQENNIENIEENEIKDKNIEKKTTDKKKKNDELVDNTECIIGNILNDVIDLSIGKAQRKEKIQELLKDDNFDLILDFKIIRTYFLKKDIDYIYKKYKCPVHVLDCAVRLACASFKSCLSNFKNKNIKHFIVRYLKPNKSSLIMDIEKTFFKPNGFFVSILGNEMKNKSNKEYIIDSECKLHYNKKNEQFTLLVPTKIEKDNSEKPNNYISIDAGLRTFLNCKTNNGYLEIGNNVQQKLEKEINRLNRIERRTWKGKKEKYLRITRERIKNKVKDMHNKIINYLTKNYKNIILGKWSTKSVISKENSVLNATNKKIIQSLCFYQFMEKLQYKCKVRGVHVRIIEEHYTTKTCSMCGSINEKVEGKKIYECINKNCKKIMDRDYNSCRNILLKSIKEINTN